MIYIGGMVQLTPSAGTEHPRDVLAFVMDCAEQGVACALVIVADTQGGAVRAPGALMAVPATGQACGYVSGGCLDRDVIMRARMALESGKPERLVYGAGSPFIDVTLPCGGRIDLLVLPDPDLQIIGEILARLDTRRATSVRYSETGIELDNGGFIYRPKLHVRIVGRGADPIACARLAIASGVSAELWSHDNDSLTEALSVPKLTVRELDTPRTPPAHKDDAYTAFVLMFHDSDWEVPLLRDALEGDAFYIGAVGSHRTHEKRCAALQTAGVTPDHIARIRGPIGLVPSMRDASMLAISTLAEIVGAYHDEARL